MPARIQTLPVAATVGRNVAALREWRSMTRRDLDRATEQAGHRVTYDALAEIEHGANRAGTPRAVTVDQLAVLARVFRVTTTELLDPAFVPHVAPIRSASARRPQTSPTAGPGGG